MARERIVVKCQMGEMFPTIDSLNCNKLGEFQCADIGGKEVWLCFQHSNILWGYFVLPGLVRQSTEGVDNNG